LPCNFPDLEKVWKIAIKFGKMVQSLEGFFQSYNNCFTSELDLFCFCFGQILFNLGLVRLQCIMNKALFLLFLKVYIDDLFDNLESGREIIVLDKGLEKVLNFGFKTPYGPWVYLLKCQPDLGPCTWSRGYFSMYTTLKRFGTPMPLLKLHLNWSL